MPRRRYQEIKSFCQHHLRITIDWVPKKILIYAIIGIVFFASLLTIDGTGGSLYAADGSQVIAAPSSSTLRAALAISHAENSGANVTDLIQNYDSLLAQLNNSNATVLGLATKFEALTRQANAQAAASSLNRVTTVTEYYITAIVIAFLSGTLFYNLSKELKRKTQERFFNKRFKK
jgi:hypothetical protein